jgi:hypothetical protein
MRLIHVGATAVNENDTDTSQYSRTNSKENYFVHGYWVKG